MKKIVCLGRASTYYEFASVFYVYYNLGLPWSVVALQTWADTVIQSMTHCMNPLAGFYRFESYSGDGDLGWLPSVATNYGFSGTRPGTLAPPQVAYCVLQRTEAKRTFSRKWIPGVTIEDTVNGVVGEEVGLFVQGFANDWTNHVDYGGGEIKQGMVNKNSDWLDFVAGYYDEYCGTMRRRRPGVGD